MIASDAFNVVVVAIALGLLVFVVVRWWSYWDVPSATRGFTSKRSQMERRSGIEGQDRQEGADDGMTGETLFCPFTRQPCIGRDCACATYIYKRGVRTWRCGMVAHLEDNEARNPILIEDERAYTGHVAESTRRD